MKTIARIFSNKPCTMVVGSSEVKALKTNRIVCLNLEVDQNHKIEFFIEKEGVIEKTLMLSLTPDSVCTAYIVSVDWSNENISCLKDNTDPTHRHLKMDENNKPHCFIYDAKTFSLCHGIDAPYEYCGDFNEFGLAKVKYKRGHGGFNDYEYGVIDKNCKVIIPLEYSDILIDRSGYILAHKNCSIVHSCLFTLNGELLFEREGVQFFDLRYIKKSPIVDYDGMIKTLNPATHAQGYINVKNEIIIDTKYSGIIRFDDNNSLFIVNTGHLHGAGVIDVNENVIISFSYDSISPIRQSSNGYIYVVCNRIPNTSEKFFTVINASEEKIIEKEFDEFQYRDNIICLLREGKWYFYNRDLTLLAIYAEEEVRLWQWIGVNVNGRWLPFDKVVNY